MLATTSRDATTLRYDAVVPRRPTASTSVRAGVLTGMSDGFFSGVLNVAFYSASVARLFQSIASTVLGRAAIDGGAGPTAVGVVMHFGVALAWSAVFVLVVRRSAAVARTLVGPYGAVKVAVVFGPCVWLAMSVVVIPLLVHRAPAFNGRWFVQLIGHFPFVGLPIAWVTRRSMLRRE